MTTSQASQFQNMFFSKDTISSLNKLLLQQTNVQNLSRDGKQELINVLIKNMKMVYKSIDLDKINNKNFDSIFNQFKKHSISESIGEIKKLNLSNFQQSPSELRMKREFDSVPNPGNKIMQRPSATKNTSINTTDNRNFIEGAMANYDSNLDNVFKPLINHNDNDFLSPYNSTRKNQNISGQMDELQQQRQMEINNRNNRPSTPPFLKSINSNPDKNNKNIDIPKINGSKPDFQNAKSSDFNQSFNGLANDATGDLYNLDNIDKPLVEGEIVEDASSFEDRLKKLQYDRENLKPIEQKRVDFTSEDFPKSESVNSNFIPINKQLPNYNSPKPIYQPPSNQLPNYNSPKPIIQTQPRLPNNTELNLESHQERERTLSQYDVKSPRTDSRTYETKSSQDLLNSMKSLNIDVSSKSNYEIKKLEEENNNLKEIITKLNNELNNKNNNELTKITEIKNQIAQEFSTLQTKNEELDIKLKKIDFREMEINRKEIELKQAMSLNEYLMKTNYLQLEISDIDNKSSYIWKSSQPINNVLGIKLMSYSLPQPRFNIISRNNLLKLRLNDKELNIEIPIGYYLITQLIEYLNKSLEEQISFEINNQHKIIMKSQNESDIINIIPTFLSQENLGFLKSNNSNVIIADRIWDLRLDDKIYLYLANIFDNPFAVLYFNGQSNGQIRFQKPFNISELNIVFKDIHGYNYDFNDLPHSLSFMLEVN
jgi:hypothetical protein